ncbi:conjugative transposon protein TraM [Euzebyella marina]|uniref:Conjugative transposon protein TraM n=1 Tax=Euzebyella marina TaxID=1761453 RepID=A0A3G2L5Q2_9FLAO|nr:conjugative transposon protein TraM [Euzebyella marina]AYN67546.1 conjugative transposon protein TraM [Euzebyella marina]
MMRLDKKRVVFYLGLATVLLFIGGYYYSNVKNEGKEMSNSTEVLTPKLVDEQKQYESKLEAIEELKEPRIKNVPSLYPEHMVDEKGYINPDYIQYEKHRLIDSIYNQSLFQSERKIATDTNSSILLRKNNDTMIQNTPSNNNSKDINVAGQELGLEHQLFFSSNPRILVEKGLSNDTEKIIVRVDGNQKIRKNYRLKMRLVKDAIIDGEIVEKNTPIYGFISFKPNRVIVDINKINHRSVELKAYDFQDGSEGIYVENQIKEEVTNEIIGDMVDDFNIAGVPPVNSLKKVFQRNHRAIKVLVLDNYQFLLGPSR